MPTSALTSSLGLVREAESGTLFLDEIDSLPVLAQVKLLRLLQEKEFRPLGAKQTSKADLRVIAATNANLEEALRAGLFRQDLYYRLNVLTLTLPPLRNRHGDIPLLSRYFVAKFTTEDNLGRLDTNAITVNLPATLSFLYDQNGNLRTNGSVVMAYDDENQLIAMTNAEAWACTFAYDGKMRLRISRDYEWRNGAWVQTNEVHRVYDGMLVLQERDQFNVPKLTYTRGKDLSGSLEGASGIGGLVALSDHSTLNSQLSTAHSYFHSDGNGNVTCLVDANQNLVARYLYDPFGNTLSATGSKAAANKFRFSSKEWNPASGLVYYGYRFYVPEFQRWPNRDPLEEAGGLNLYQYVHNSPLNYIDPDGEEAVSIGIGIGVGAGATGGTIGAVGTGGIALWGAGWMLPSRPSSA